MFCFVSGLIAGLRAVRGFEAFRVISMGFLARVVSLSMGAGVIAWLQ
jgi:hypothetical protein